MRETLSRLVIPTGSHRIGSLFGVPLQAHPSSLLFIVLIAASSKAQFTAWMPQGTSAILLWAMALLGLLTFLASLLAHEFGHVLVARRHGTACREVTLTPFGMAAQMDDDAHDATEEAFVTAAGPGVSIALALAGWGLTFAIPDGLVSLWAWFLVCCNGVIAAFNLVPCYPLDGGRIVRAFAWHLTGDLSRATRVAARVGMGGAGVLVGYGALLLVLGNPAGLMTIGFAVALVAFTASENRARSENDAYLAVTASKLMLPFGPATDMDGFGMSLAPTMERGRLAVHVAVWEGKDQTFSAPSDRFGRVEANAGPQAILDAFEARPQGRWPLIVMDAGMPVGYLTEGRARVLGMPRRPPMDIEEAAGT